MAGARGRGLRPGSVLRALVRLVLFVVVGFGVGLFFGVVTEEPELLAGHLRGDSASLALTDDREGHSADDDSVEAVVEESDLARSGERDEEPAIGDRVEPVTAAEPRREVGALYESARQALLAQEPAGDALPSVAAPSRQAAPPPRADASASSGPRRGWAIQVGAFSEESAARRLADGLEEEYPVEILPADSRNRRWRVRVQPIKGEARARALADQLKRDERLPTWVTPMKGASGS